MPSVDGREIPANPLWMLDVAPSGLVNFPSPVPYLTGVNKQDGIEVCLSSNEFVT